MNTQSKQILLPLAVVLIGVVQMMICLALKQPELLVWTGAVVAVLAASGAFAGTQFTRPQDWWPYVALIAGLMTFIGGLAVEIAVIPLIWSAVLCVEFSLGLPAVLFLGRRSDRT